MTVIEIENGGKRYNRDWIFSRVNYQFITGKKYAITGNNGSGKSTFLQTLSGAIELKEGKLSWSKKGIPIPMDQIFRHFSIVAPYLDMVEEFTATEFLEFHRSFKPFYKKLSIPKILELIQLSGAQHKQIRYFSSGMKQRIKLAQAIFSDADVLLMDEPCTNLDAEGYHLYNELINGYCKEKLIIVSSNDENEYRFCEEIIDIRNYK